MEAINTLKEFIVDIQHAEALDRDSVILDAITTRLDKCLDTYILTLNKDINYLKYRNQLKLVRKLSK